MAVSDDSPKIGRTDPDQDPLGSRLLFILELALGYCDDALNLREQIPQQDPILSKHR